MRLKIEFIHVLVRYEQSTTKYHTVTMNKKYNLYKKKPSN